MGFFLADSYIWDLVGGLHIGGRERNVVRVAEELALLGWQATIYCPIGDVAVKNQVTYAPLALPSSDVLVILNGYEILGENPPGRKVSWVPTGLPNLREYRDQIDQVVVSSPLKGEALRKVNPWLKETKVKAIYSGTDPCLYDVPIPRQTNRLLWCSARDRGLHHLLRWWPRLRQVIPDLTLHITYDRTTLDPWRWQMEVRTEICRQIDQGVNQPGITDLGAVSQADLVKEQKECSLWACPVEFYGGLDSGSFSIPEMCAARTPMLLAPDPSVTELGHDAAHFIPYPIQDIPWIDGIVDLLGDEAKRRKFESRQAEIAAIYTWKSTARQWDTVLQGLVA